MECLTFLILILCKKPESLEKKALMLLMPMMRRFCMPWRFSLVNRLVFIVGWGGKENGRIRCFGVMFA